MGVSIDTATFTPDFSALRLLVPPVFEGFAWWSTRRTHLYQLPPAGARDHVQDAPVFLLGHPQAEARGCHLMGLVVG